MNKLIPTRSSLAELIPTTPELIAQSGDASMYAWGEFLTEANSHTKEAYTRAVQRFLTWCEQLGIVELQKILPLHIQGYLKEYKASIPTKKLALSAIRKFFGYQVIRHAIFVNPADSVKTERFSVDSGSTTPLLPDDSRRVMSHIDTSTIKGMRDKAIIGMLTFTACRVGALVKLNLGDFYQEGNQSFFKLEEKNGKVRKIPVRSTLEDFLFTYIKGAGLSDQHKDTALFRSTPKGNKISDRRISRVGLFQMVRTRIKEAGITGTYSPHSFRAGTATALLTQGVEQADVQFLLGHSDPRTTQLYDHRHKTVTRNLVERI